jgi:hypothetical protein
MQDGNILALQLHEMLTYLGQLGVVTIMVLADSGGQPGRRGFSAGQASLVSGASKTTGFDKGNEPQDPSKSRSLIGDCCSICCLRLLV